MENKKEVLKGFVLLELLIALAVFSIGIVTIFNLIFQATKGPYLSVELTNAYFVNQENFTALKTLLKEKINPGVYKAGINEEKKWTLFPQRGLGAHFILAGDSKDWGPYQIKTIKNKISFTFNQKGQRLGAAKFNGQDSYIKTKDAFSLKKGGPLTISLWIKKIGSQGPIAGRYDLSQGKGSFLLIQEGNFYRFLIQGPQGEDFISATSTFLPWENLVAVYDPGGPFLKIYLNGKLKNSKETFITSLNFLGEIEFFIGTDSSLSSFFEGAISDLRVYNRALTSEEVSALYGSYSAKREKYLMIKEIEKEPRGIWNFYEGEGCILHDESKNSNHGILKPDCPASSTSPLWKEDRKGNQKSSLFFNQNSFVLIKDHPSLQLKDEISLSLWVKFAQPLSEISTTTILQKRAKTSEDFSFALFYSPNKKGYGFGISRGRPENLEAVFSKDTAIAGKWQHILVSFDGENRKIYIDNREITSLETGFWENSGGDSHLYLGQSSQGNQRLKGYLDELRIFDKILSFSERKALFLGKRIYFLEGNKKLQF